ncbi:MAG: hypothetical protein OEZ16_09270 [Chromatiales bacterium]|nr:hypothetical protein [Chromatiales bacterium]
MAITLRRAGKRVVLVALLAMSPVWVFASQADSLDLERSVFEFQSKLANQGNAAAQYYLAQMYGEGRGTRADPALAEHWYEKAKLNGFNPSILK